MTGGGEWPTGRREFVQFAAGAGALGLSSRASAGPDLGEEITITGDIQRYNEDSEADQWVVASRADGTEVDFDQFVGGGPFSVTVPSGQGLAYSFVQGDAGSDTAVYFDENPDVRSLGAFKYFSDTDLGVFELPRAYKVDIQVVDEDGDPVEDAWVRVRHETETFTYTDGRTNADGLFEAPHTTPGIELEGECTILAAPPQETNPFTGSGSAMASREVTISSPRSLDIALSGDGSADSDTVPPSITPQTEFARIGEQPTVRARVEDAGAGVSEDDVVLRYYDHDCEPDTEACDPAGVVQMSREEGAVFAGQIPEGYDYVGREVPYRVTARDSSAQRNRGTSDRRALTVLPDIRSTEELLVIEQGYGRTDDIDRAELAELMRLVGNELVSRATAKAAKSIGSRLLSSAATTALGTLAYKFTALGLELSGLIVPVGLPRASVSLFMLWPSDGQSDEIERGTHANVGPDDPVYLAYYVHPRLGGGDSTLRLTVERTNRTVLPVDSTGRSTPRGQPAEQPTTIAEFPAEFRSSRVEWDEGERKSWKVLNINRGQLVFRRLDGQPFATGQDIRDYEITAHLEQGGSVEASESVSVSVSG